MNAETQKTAPNTHRGQIPPKPAPAMSGLTSEQATTGAAMQTPSEMITGHILKNGLIYQATVLETTSLVRLCQAASNLRALADSGVLFEGYDGAEPQRTAACAALDELEHATACAVDSLHSILKRRQAREISDLRSIELFSELLTKE